MKPTLTKLQALSTAAIFALLSASCAAKPASPPDLASADAQQTPVLAPINRCDYFDEATFDRNRLAARPYQNCEGIYAATVPHYAPMLYLAASVLETLAAGEPFDTVVVIGPDHEGRGNGVVLSGSGWDTPFGVLSGDGQTADAISQNPVINAEVNHDILALDHAAAVLMPYIKHYLPDVSVTAVLLGNKASPTRLNALAATIHDLSQEKRVFILASIDFSHYQDSEMCREMDKVTADVIASGDRQTLLAMDGKNLDSPECLSVLLELGELAGRPPALIDHETLYYTENARQYAASYFIYALQAAADPPPSPLPDPDEKTRIRLAAVGDNLLHNTLLDWAKVPGGYDFTPLYRHIKEWIGGADLAFVNQESPIMSDRPPRGYPRFNAPPQAGLALIETGFDVVCHANNHALDMGGRASPRHTRSGKRPAASPRSGSASLRGSRPRR